MADREHAQAEYQYLKNADLKRSKAKWLEPRVLISKSAWSIDSVLDFTNHVVVTTAAYFF